MKKVLSFMLLVSVLMSGMILFSGCEYTRDKGSKWEMNFDILAPNLANAGADADSANADGWYQTMNDDFDRNTLGDIWNPVPHYKRNVEYWCDEMVSLKNGKVEVLAEKRENHSCNGDCPTEGLFTSGIETTKKVDGKKVPTFEQAFGYFEATVEFPNSGGMWSAFWLQSNSMQQIGNKGEDGSEIDIYESSFWKNKTNVGHCIHYDGYGSKHKAGDSIRDTGKDLYKGYHTFALKWTPSEYVFYVDGVVSWATDFGGVSKVPAFLMLTNEIRPNKIGPYGQSLGDFDGGIFRVENVKVFQNINYIESIGKY